VAGAGADAADRPAALAPALRAQIAVPDAARMRALGERLAVLLRAGDLVVLTGPLGAGKTTLVQGIGAGLGVRGPVTSPTFVIARVHPALADGPDLVHADAYRLGSRAEIDDLDLDADSGHSVTVVEWGEGLAEDLAPGYLQITITMGQPGVRGDGRAPREREEKSAGPAAAGADTAEFPAGLAEPGDEPRTVVITGWGQRWEEAAEPARLGLAGARDVL
jgi:tRNA threonylcarbamoyladenosine biosynthesis protein TsaE